MMSCFKKELVKPPLIAIYDSGVGGLLVMQEFLKKIPGASYIYYADSANMPYGNKTGDQIFSWTQNILAWLSLEFSPDFLVSACNTSSSSLKSRGYQSPYDKFFYSPLDVLQEDVVLKSQNIIVACTKATADSRVHERIILKNNPSAYVATVGYRDLAYLIENGASQDAIQKEIFDQLQKLDRNIKWDALICGCTHYSIAQDHFFQFFRQEFNQNKAPQFIDPSVSMVYSVLQGILKIENQSLFLGVSDSTFYCNDMQTENFDEKISKYLKVQAQSLYHNPHKEI